MITKKEILDAIHGKMIISCQAVEDEPLYVEEKSIMYLMARAAKQAGTPAIRTSSIRDVIAIKEETGLPVIGLVKIQYPGYEGYITPTMKEVDALVECGVSIIAADATDSDKRPRPDGKSLDEFFGEVREKYPDQLFMADCSSYEEGMHAAEIGFDLIGTTMNGYTAYTKGTELPNIELMRQLARDCGKPVIAEGGIWLPDQLKAALDAGVHAAVIGGAITRPMEITKRFVAAIQ